MLSARVAVGRAGVLKGGVQAGHPSDRFGAR